MLKQSPWSSAIEKGIDSLAGWLILTLGRPVDLYIYVCVCVCNIIKLTKKKGKTSIFYTFKSI